MGNFAKELFEAQERSDALRIRSWLTRGGEGNLGRLGGDGRGEKGDSEAHERRGLVSAALDGPGRWEAHGCRVFPGGRSTEVSSVCPRFWPRSCCACANLSCPACRSRAARSGLLSMRGSALCVALEAIPGERSGRPGRAQQQP
jgi:hypothetical protein